MNIKDIKKHWEPAQIKARIRYCLVALGIIDDIQTLTDSQLRNTRTR